MKNTTVTEEMEIIPATPGEEKSHRFLKVCGYGTYKNSDGDAVVKPQINLNAKCLAEAGFDIGDQVEVTVVDNDLIIRKMIPSL